MGALAPSAHTWIPEDDLLLKNAVEAGASLESLAKGAVQFSQRFNIEQIQERWRLLLYHPVVSKEASARMTELDPSAPKSAKRKPESIRKCYYSYRKRICNNPFTSTDLNCINPPHNNNDDTINNDNDNNNINNISNSNENNEKSTSNNDDNDVVAGSENIAFFIDPVESQYRIADPNFDIAADDAFSNFGINDSTTKAFCDEKNCTEDLNMPQDFDDEIPVGDIFVSADGFLGSGEFDQVNSNGLEFFSWDSVDPVFPSINFLNEEQQSESNFGLAGDPDLNNNNQSSGPAGSDEFLAELSNSLLNLDNEDDLIHMDGNVKDTVDSYHSLLLGCPKEGEALNIKNIPVLEEPANTGQVNEGQREKGKNLNSCKSPFSMCSVTLNPELPELNNRGICCVLNTEDQEIPCNEDVFLLSHISSESVPFRENQESDMPTYLPTDIYAANNIDDYVPEMIRRQPIRRQPFVTSCSISAPQSVNHEVRGNFDIQQLPSLCSHPSNKRTSNTDDIPKGGQDVDNADETVKRSNNGLRDIDVLSDTEDDDIVLSYSDIEAMILEMDLVNDDLSTRNETISRYQDEETVKKIIRLESCVSNSMQRSLEYESALAVLSGDDLKFFITQPEVVVGRSTEDATVDIDIGRHHSYKISRRQAIIKLDNNGCFHLTNLGKIAIYVSGSKVASRHTSVLPSGCLIDIRGQTFIFETCPRKIEEYLN